MNQIINMIIRQVMNQLIRRGVSAGFNKAGEMGQRRKMQNLPPDALDDHGNPVNPQQELTPQERRQQRAARQQARQARMAMKAGQRMNKL
ncbi:MAG: hypothetical protein AB8B60_02885 [Sulfitobacter sp.]